MEKNDIKKVMLAVMMLTMIVVAQGRAVAPATDFQPNASTKDCGIKCSLQCAPKLLRPPQFALCVGLCMVACKSDPGQLVYNCTSVCAKSAINSNPKAGHETVRRYIDKCYGSCKNKI